MATKLIRGNVTNLRWSVSAAGDFETGSTAGDVVSDWYNFAEENAAIQLLWTGTTEGTLSVEFSNDGTNVAASYATTDFVPNLTNPAGTASGTAGQFASDFALFRVKFVRSAGTGTITGTVTAKQ